MSESSATAPLATWCNCGPRRRRESAEPRIRLIRVPTILNNREWATVIWFAIFVLWILTRRELRRSVGHLLAAVFRTKLLILICGTAAWVFGLVMLGRVVGLWTAALLGTTVLWFAGAALVLVMRSTGVSNETGFTSKAFKRAIGIAGLVAGCGSLYVFPLVIELILLPVLVMLAAVLALAELRDEHAALRKPLRSVFAFIGVVFLVYVVVHVVADLSGAHLLKSSPLRTRAARVMAQAHRTVLTGDWQGLALPVWLTSVCCRTSISSASWPRTRSRSC